MASKFHPTAMPSEVEHAKARRCVIIAQCAGLIGETLFANGFILSYFSKAGIQSTTVLFLLALPAIAQFVLALPAAFYSDRIGKRIIGIAGLWINLAGMLVLIAAPVFSGKTVLVLAVIGAMVAGIGLTLNSAVFFAWVNPFIPEHMRGRFFGRLGTAFQTTVIAFTLVVTAILKFNSEIGVYQMILVAVACLLLLRIYYFHQIPELDRPTSHSNPTPFKTALATVMKAKGFSSYYSYVFLLLFAIGSVPWILGLLEKDILSFTPAQLIWMGNLLSLGLLTGSYCGGKLIDRHGVKPALWLGHLSFSGILAMVPFRSLMPAPFVVILGILTFLFGMMWGVSTLGMTTETLSRIPSKNKSLHCAFIGTLFNGGIALSALLYGRIFDLKLLSSSWHFYGQPMSHYDALIINLSLAVLVLTVILKRFRSAWKATAPAPTVDEAAQGPRVLRIAYRKANKEGSPGGRTLPLRFTIVFLEIISAKHHKSNHGAFFLRNKPPAFLFPV